MYTLDWIYATQPFENKSWMFNFILDVWSKDMSLEV